MSDSKHTSAHSIQSLDSGDDDNESEGSPYAQRRRQLTVWRPSLGKNSDDEDEKDDDDDDDEDDEEDDDDDEEDEEDDEEDEDEDEEEDED